MYLLYIKIVFKGKIINSAKYRPLNKKKYMNVWHANWMICVILFWTFKVKQKKRTKRHFWYFYDGRYNPVLRDIKCMRRSRFIFICLKRYFVCKLYKGGVFWGLYRVEIRHRNIYKLVMLRDQLTLIIYIFNWLNGKSTWIKRQIVTKLLCYI